MNEQQILQILLGEFYDKLVSSSHLVPREACFREVENKIKVAIGMRRVGKTTIVFQEILKIIGLGVDKKRILYINFEDDRLLQMDEKKLAKLIEAFYSLYPENHEQKCYLFFDEIQNVQNWPIVVRRFYDSRLVEIYLTGSSAKLLSKEIATSLRGRSLATEVWPYSFNEFLCAKNLSIDRTLFSKKTEDRLVQAFHLYLTEGGFPEVVNYNSETRNRTLQDYLDVVIYRDIIERHKVKNPTLIKYMLLSMIQNISKPFTINKFYNDVKSQGYKVGKDALYEYAAHIEDAFCAFVVPIYEKSLRKEQTNPKKIYAVDPGLVRAVTLDFQGDLGRLFENVVYLDLRRTGCKVSYYLTAERYEVDFLIQTVQGEKKLLQVVWQMDDMATFEREQRALESAMKEMKIEGKIITLDSYLREGIGL
ncbi:MAG: ATP-binding protein [Chlamydiales bacterium]